MIIFKILTDKLAKGQFIIIPTIAVEIDKANGHILICFGWINRTVEIGISY